mgnify:FL=1
MRIIGGKFKGKKILFLRSKLTRPLKDFVKENIFNVLNHSNKFDIDVNKSEVLDLYAGSGSFGLECISRGAKRVTFIEQDVITFKTLSKNLDLFSIKEKYNLINTRVESALNKLKGKKFDIFFFDPPFEDVNVIKNLEEIKQMEIFKTQHLIIIHRENKKTDFNSRIINILETKNYRRSKIYFAVF